MNKAIIIVDVQNDFCPGGSLAVKDGDQIIQPLNEALTIARNEGWKIIASRDWHPRVTNHFKEHGGIWPTHCVAGTEGAKFHKDLDIHEDIDIVVSKGTKPNEDAYSAFQGTDKYLISLQDILYAYCIKELYIGGLATDYCVKHTVLTAISFGYKVNLLMNCCKAVDLKAGDGMNAIGLMAQLGANLVLKVPKI